MSPIAHRAGGKVTWLKSQWKLSAYPAHFCVEIYMVFLPFDLDPAHHAAAAQDGFNNALNVSVRLGMIAAIVLPA
jgi:hypothetical protein